MDGAINVIEYLISKNIPLDRQDSRGLTPLHIAVGSRNIPIIKRLCEAGARIDVPNIEGLSPLDLAESARDNILMNVFKRYKNKNC